MEDKGRSISQGILKITYVSCSQLRFPKPSQRHIKVTKCGSVMDPYTNVIVKSKERWNENELTSVWTAHTG